ncbi:hypothetical protein XYCOK13_22990 [Xylanibacillus composti]|uniref:Regulator of chromosome condensation (RCC1) repeat-containing protein n=1 Tax=Xylanibacillus composti TaxID=1572762 RepID=A0A8J4H4H4_9BACL|nr:hypothetical protein [Xylanibacillus composti]GIQ69475.1 hypothetical protein XYCOK13_22990 [Xylanibacillus composti]
MKRWLERGRSGKLLAVLLAGSLLLSSTAYAEDRSGQNKKWLEDVVHIATGDVATYAVKKDGSAWAWGGHAGQRDVGERVNRAGFDAGQDGYRRCESHSGRFRSCPDP